MTELFVFLKNIYTITGKQILNELKSTTSNQNENTLSKFTKDQYCHYLIVHEGFETLNNFMLVLFVNLLLPRDRREQ